MTINELIEMAVAEIEKMDDKEELEELLREIWHADGTFFVRQNRPEEGPLWDLICGMLKAAQRQYELVTTGTAVNWDLDDPSNQPDLPRFNQ